MSNKYIEHSKFVYKNFDEIQSSINSGELDAWDLVLSKDTKEFILIKDNLELAPIKSKLYRFLDVDSAEIQLNASTDTYGGQLVAILSDSGSYEGYIVNQKSNGRFKVDPLNAYTGSLDYDTLSHRPIINVESHDYFSPVVLDQMKEGFYKINGTYKISESIETVFTSYSSLLFWVHRDEEENVYIKRIGATDITDFVIYTDGTTSTAVVPTTEWLKAQGYVTEPYIDAKIAALDFINKTDIEEYVQGVVLQTISTMVVDVVNDELDKRLVVATHQEALQVFNSVFNKNE